jgi:hypothetical protein
MDETVGREIEDFRHMAVVSLATLTPARSLAETIV